jgi:hypothetical protein
VMKKKYRYSVSSGRAFEWENISFAERWGVGGGALILSLSNAGCWKTRNLEV